MKAWKKILIAVIGSGINGGLTYSSSLYPEWVMVFGPATLAISGAMSVIIGWPPKKE